MTVAVFGAVGTALAGAVAADAAVEVPAGVTTDQVVLVDLYLEGNRTVTAPDGTWTLLGGAPVATSLQWHYKYWRRATGADSGTYSFTWTGSVYRRGVAARYTGCPVTGDPVDAFSSAARSSAGTTTPAVSVDTTGRDRLLVWSGTDVAVGTWTPPTNFTERVDSDELTVADTPLVVPGSSGSVTGTSTGSEQQTGYLVALRPAGATGPLTTQPSTAPRSAANF